MSKLILCVDDEPSNLDYLREDANAMNIPPPTMYYLNSAEEAKLLFEHPTEIFHDPHLELLVITDQNMPGMSGFELAELVKERFPRALRGIVLHSFTTDPNLAAAMERACKRQGIEFCAKGTTAGRTQIRTRMRQFMDA